LAGIGSTHPEELRAERRRQLEIQKKGIQSQLELLAASRIRLEAAIARADTLSYQQSAGGPQVASEPATRGSSPTKRIQRPRKPRPKKRRPSGRHQP
jgi:hypothetical protein